MLRAVKGVYENGKVRLLEEVSGKESMEVVVTFLRKAPRNRKTKRSILELEGLGKEMWQKTDTDEYIGKERDAWGGR